MSEKRYYSVDYDEQYYIFDSDVIRKGRVEEEAEYSYDVFANSMSSTEIIDKLNELTNENEQLKHKVNGLKSELAIWKEDANEHIQETNKLFEENNQLKKELTKFKEWEKHIGDVKREELDRVFKMSVYEIVEGFEYYQKRIKELETVIQQILYETRANHTKGEYSIIVSVLPQMHDKLSNLIMKRMW